MWSSTQLSKLDFSDTVRIVTGQSSAWLDIQKINIIDFCREMAVKANTVKLLFYFGYW